MQLLETSVNFEPVEGEIEVPDTEMTEDVEEKDEFSEFLQEVFSDSEIDQKGDAQSSFIPDRRDLYLSLLNNQTPTSFDTEKRMEEISELAKYIDPENLAQDHGISELCDFQIKVEMRAVWKIKIRFSKWLEECVTNIVRVRQNEID